MCIQLHILDSSVYICSLAQRPMPLSWQSAANSSHDGQGDLLKLCRVIVQLLHLRVAKPVTALTCRRVLSGHDDFESSQGGNVKTIGDLAACGSCCGRFSSSVPLKLSL
mmetsp:Transcript_140993/g.256282  ORF Transcript_140993/g.256282 Transcript_140993/m.256282 type:complete len:109 (+) Transcript_140993:90-416(+)